MLWKTSLSVYGRRDTFASVGQSHLSLIVFGVGNLKDAVVRTENIVASGVGAVAEDAVEGNSRSQFVCCRMVKKLKRVEIA
jgi:hypothetical protein